MTHRAKTLAYELFRIYKIHRFLLIQLGLILMASGLVPWFESGVDGAKLTSFSHALWWSFSTVTSTGYGDYVPITGAGRIIGVILMLSGLSLLSTVVALVASYFAYGRTKRSNLRIQRQMETVEERLNSIESKIDYLVKNGLRKK